MPAGKQKRKYITVRITSGFDTSAFSLPHLKKLVKNICARFNLSRAVISLVIVGDAQIRKLNKRFLNRNCSTDCLSFDLSDNGPDRVKSIELIVNAQMAARQAKLRRHSTEAELALYITHALLHNLGFDDSAKPKAKKMHDTEDKILQQLGYGLVYNKTNWSY